MFTVSSLEEQNNGIAGVLNWAKCIKWISCFCRLRFCSDVFEQPVPRQLCHRKYEEESMNGRYLVMYRMAQSVLSLL